MRANPKGVAFADAVKIAEYFFGQGRQSGTSPMVFKMPWAGDPRVNLQNSGGGAKAYQVRQLLRAVDRRLDMITSPAAEEAATQPRKGKRHGR